MFRVSFIVTLLFYPLFAQAKTVEIEFDPTAYIFDGFSLHYIVDNDMGFRIDAGVFGITVPEVFEPNNGFETRQQGIGFKIDYYGRRQDGLFIGLQYDLTQVKATNKDNGENLTTTDDFGGIRIGYRWGIEGFYISPWLLYQKRLETRESDTIGGKTYSYKRASFYPFVHIGYRF